MRELIRLLVRCHCNRAIYYSRTCDRFFEILSRYISLSASQMISSIFISGGISDDFAPKLVLTLYGLPDVSLYESRNCVRFFLNCAIYFFSFRSLQIEATTNSSPPNRAATSSFRIE